MSTMQATRNRITLRGSTKIVVEFFEYSINSILYQRAIYPPEDFKMARKYGLNMLVTTDAELKTYLKQVMSQVEAWLMAGKVNKLVMAVKSKDTGTVLERWQFDIHVTAPPTVFQHHADTPLHQLSTSSQQQQQPTLVSSSSSPSTSSPSLLTRSKQSAISATVPEKTEQQIQAEIQGVIRQITASVTFLPTLTEQCTWTVLCYTDKDAEVPLTWKDVDEHKVLNAEQVKFRSFGTNVHQVDAMVAYRLNDDY